MKIDSQKYISNLLRDRIWFLRQSIERNKLLTGRVDMDENMLFSRPRGDDEKEIEEAEFALKELDEVVE